MTCAPLSRGIGELVIDFPSTGGANAGPIQWYLSSRTARRSFFTSGVQRTTGPHAIGKYSTPTSIAKSNDVS